MDDNRDLLHFLERLMADAGWTLLTAESATDAKKLMVEKQPNAALLDYMLPDGNGVELAQQLKQVIPNLQVIMMTGWNDYRKTVDQLEKCALKAVLRPFISNIHEAYAAADLVVSRSGAGAVAAALGRPVAGQDGDGDQLGGRLPADRRRRHDRSVADEAHP